MPIRKKWSRLTEGNIRKLGNAKGAYEIADRNKKPLDIGKGDGRSGVSTRLRAKKKMYPAAQYFRAEQDNWFDSGKDLEAKHSQAHRKKYGKRPPKNKRSPPVRNLFGW